MLYYLSHASKLSFFVLYFVFEIGAH
jgi:hypothetical protein